MKLRYWKAETEVAGDTEIVTGLPGYFATDPTDGSSENDAVTEATMHQISIFPSGGSDVVFKLAIMPHGGTYVDVMYIKDENGDDISIDTATFQNGSKAYVFEAAAAIVALIPQGEQAENESVRVFYSNW